MSTAIILTPTPTPSTPSKLGRTVALAFSVLALACSGAAQAQSHGGWHGGGHNGGAWHGGGSHGGGWHGGGYYRGGWGWPLWGLGVGVGLGLASSYYYDGPSYVVVDQPAPLYYYPPPAPAYAVPSRAAVPAVAPAPAADPIFYPRNGQDAAQEEADRQACNRWATTYPKAMEDGSIFQRATLACMDGRGYTSR